MNKHFIKASNDFCTFENHISAPYLRKEFTLDFVPETAEISICGLGFYVLYINGVDVTKGLLAPYISNPDQYCYYDTYNIKEHLVKGKNVIGVILGNGMMNAFGGYVWDFDKAEGRGAPRLALELCAECGENKVTIVADESFKVHPSPITFDDLRMGEYYDANLEIEDWNLSGFDDSDWAYAVPAETPRGALRKCEVEPIIKKDEIKPVKIIKNKNGYMYDFGVNNAGICKLRINAEKGQKIILRHGEVLDENAELDRQGITFWMKEAKQFSDNNQMDIYIAKGEKTEEYVPHFTFHDFRYVEVSGISEEQATPELLTYYTYSSDIKTIGDFKCSNDTVNTLFEMVKRSDITNFFYFPMDCPHREKNGWTGDASLSSDHTLLIYNVVKSWQEWLFSVMASQLEDGQLPGIAPTYTWGYEGDFGPNWDAVLFNLPYMAYKMRGNTDLIKENEPAMMRYLNYVLNRLDENGLVSFGFGDWLPVGTMDFKSPVPVTSTITVMDISRKASEMFAAIGCKNQADFAEGIYKDLRRAFREKLIDKDTLAVYGDSQTGQAMALYYGAFEPEEEEKAFGNLMQYIKDNGNNFDCGCLGMHVLLHVLTKFGESELAYNMITKKEYPSYAHLIEKGETTMVEQFMPDDKPCGSHNHHFFGDIGRWFINHIAGLNIVDYGTVLVKPEFLSDINFAQASYELPKGKVSVCWERIGDDIKLDVSCPDSVKYSISLPKGYVLDGNKVKKSA